MTVTSTRLGRLGSPQHHKTPRSPMCHECTTDLYLKFRVFLPSTRKRSRVPGLRRIMGRVRRSAVRSGGRIEYFCQKCGTQQHHLIPEGWEPTSKGLTPCDVQDLASVFIAPGESLPTEEVRQQLLGPEPAPAARAEKTLSLRESRLPA